jgi:hypothetical protein
MFVLSKKGIGSGQRTHIDLGESEKRKKLSKEEWSYPFGQRSIERSIGGWHDLRVGGGSWRRDEGSGRSGLRGGGRAA